MQAERKLMIEFVERVGVEPKVVPVANATAVKGKPEDKAKEDKKKRKKKDDDADATFDKAQKQQEDDPNEKDVRDR